MRQRVRKIASLCAGVVVAGALGVAACGDDSEPGFQPDESDPGLEDGQSPGEGETVTTFTSDEEDPPSQVEDPAR